MKKLALFLVLFLFSVAAHAELNRHEAHVVDLMTDGELRSLKIAARKIHDTKMSNPEVLDMAAEILLKNYPNVYKAQLDTFSWLVRAIGTSKNGRYHSAIQEVVDTTHLKKLRRHAKKALKVLGPAGDAKQYQLGDLGKEVPEYL